MTQQDKVAKWQRRLEEAFRGEDGVVGSRLQQLQLAEADSQSNGVTSARGLVVLADAFFDFAIESHELIRQNSTLYHLIRTSLLTTTVSRLRASYLLCWNGYFFDACALLRSVFENTIVLGADAHKWSSITKLYDYKNAGVEPSHDDALRRMERHRRPLIQSIEQRMFRQQSGLSASDQDEIGSLMQILHSHVHRSESHLVFLITDSIRDRRPPELAPRWDDQTASLYANSMVAFAWMTSRLIAHAVPGSLRSDTWLHRGTVLDESMEEWFRNWTQPLGGTICRIVAMKFTFDGEWASHSID